MKKFFILALVCSAWCHLRAAVPLPAKDWIWIEAENPSAGNFPAPKDNPYRPGEFWESDPLSGGDWIGMKWTRFEEQPFLEYTFDAPAAETYQLYARKFFTFGNFRWKIDGGSWHETAISDSVPLDAVPFRETSERVSLDWFFMGGVAMEKGRHTLRVEPLAPNRVPAVEPPAFEPLAYDAFLFTPSPFIPKGKLKPGERYDVQSAEGFSMEPAPDSFRASPIDWRSLNEDFAGQNGGLVITDGRLEFRDSRAPVRLLGVNIGLGAFANAGSVDSLARFLAKKGFNLARFDLSYVIFGARGESGEIQLKTDAAQFDLLLRAIQALKENGIYTAITWDVRGSRDVLTEVWGELALPPDGRATVMRRSICPLLYFDPSLQNEYRKVWKSVLDAKLPDGGRLGADPALAFLTINQQASIFSEAFSPYEMVPPEQMPPIEKAFAKWLPGRMGGKSLASILKEWGGEAIRGDQPDDGRVGLLGSTQMAARRDARASDTARFLAETQAGFFKSMAGYLKDDLGYRGLVSTSNKLTGAPGALGWINAWSQEGGDFTERHGNFLPQFEERYGIWNAGTGSRYQDRSALRFDPLPRRKASRFDLPIRSLSYDDKPVFFTEMSWAMPNRFRSEMPLLATTLASLQQVPVLAFASISTSYWLGAATGDRTPFFTAATMGQMPAFAYAFRNGLLPEGPVVATLSMTEKSLFSMKPRALSENFDTQIDASLFDETTPPKGSPNPALWTTGRINVRLGAAPDSLESTPAGTITDSSIQAAGGCVKWDYKNGLFLVDAPSCKAAGGFLKKAGRIALGGIEIESDMEYGVICLVALDGQPVSSSKQILVQVFSEESNSESYAEGNPLKTIWSIGRPPTLAKNFSGQIRFLRPDADALVAHALDDNGYKTLTTGVGANLKLLPATMYYLIEK